MNRSLVGVIVICLIVMFMLLRKALDYRNEAMRLESNEYALMNPTQGRVVNLTEDQFEDRLGFKIDSLSKVHKERMKHIIGLTTIKTKIVRQNVPMEVIRYDTITKVKQLAYFDSCFKVSVIDTTLSIQFNDTIEIVNYMGKRSKKLLFIRYGKRHEHVKAFSKCGTIEVGSVKVVNE